MLSSLRDTVASEKRNPVLDMDRPVPPPRSGGEAFVKIEYDMMQKGSHVVRHGVEMRQYLIMVNGSVRIVNSGDVVDRATEWQPSSRFSTDDNLLVTNVTRG